VTGYDRLAPGTACVEGVWLRWCLLRQRRSTFSCEELSDRSPYVPDELDRHTGQG
jgi:hypothetical protein